jgi:hypothetical protein
MAGSVCQGAAVLIALLGVVPAAAQFEKPISATYDGWTEYPVTGTLPESMAIDRDGAVYAGETTTGHTIRKFVARH